MPSVNNNLNNAYNNATIRRVQNGGVDNSSCLSPDSDHDPTPCATLQYALQTTLDAEVYSDVCSVCINRS